MVVGGWVRDRRTGYLAGGAVAVLAGLFAVANFAPGPGQAGVPAPAADTAVTTFADPPEPAPVRVDSPPGGGANAPTAALPAQPVVAPHERVPKPDTVRGLYLNAWAAGSPRFSTC